MEIVAQSLRSAEIVEVTADFFKGGLWRFRVTEFEFGIFADMLFQANVEVVFSAADEFDNEFIGFLVDQPQGIIAFGGFVDNFVYFGDAHVEWTLHI